MLMIVMMMMMAFGVAVKLQAPPLPAPPSTSNATGCCLPASFPQLRRRTKYVVGCATVFVTVAFYPKMKNFRKIRYHGSPLAFPPVQYQDVPRRCKVGFINNDGLRSLPHAPMWSLETIEPIHGLDLQRSAHSVKIILPFLFAEARHIFYGDLKCNGLGARFSGQAAQHFPGKSLLLLRHPPDPTVAEEIYFTRKAMKHRNKPPSVFDDIERLWQRYQGLGYTMTRKKVPQHPLVPIVPLQPDY